jgi:hypothetical protein
LRRALTSSSNRAQRRSAFARNGASFRGKRTSSFRINRILWIGIQIIIIEAKITKFYLIFIIVYLLTTTIVKLLDISSRINLIITACLIKINLIFLKMLILNLI